MVGAVYNEIDPTCVRWLENLIAGGYIAPGRVDGRSIAELRAADVVGRGQRHFFSGIAGWSLGLRRAGVPDDADIWTGSCPCQSLSVAGLQRGASDPRHLWPVWYELISECKPPVVFGEQVAGALGRDWFTAVRSDLEGLGYLVGAADLAAAGVGAPHSRQRLLFGAVRMGDADADAIWRLARTASRAEAEEPIADRPVGLGPATPGDDGPWSAFEWVECDDPIRGRIHRPAPVGLAAMADGVPPRVGELSAYGNAVCPQVVAHFAAAFLDAVADELGMSARRAA